MAAPRFISRTDLATLTPLAAGGLPAVEQFPRLRDTLIARAGDDAARLFAEPVITKGNGENPGSISWYAEGGAEAERWVDLPPERRAQVENLLGQRLARLATLRDDGELGPLLRAALAIPGLDRILVLDGQPVLVGWGLAPSERATEPDIAEALWRSNLARFATAAAVPPPPRPVAPPPMAAPVSPQPAPSAAAPITAVATVAQPWRWWTLPALVGAALAFMLLGVWIGWTLLYDKVAGQVGTASIIDEAKVREQIEIQKKTNEALEREIAKAKQALAGNVCTAENPLGVPLPEATPVTPASLPPPPSGQKPFQGNLLDLLDQATVLVIASKADGTALGTGFFVTPDRIVTNDHVVNNADPAKLYVTSKKLGGVKRVQIAARSGESGMGKKDFALLGVEATQVQPLALSGTVARIDDVIAAGFPGLIIDADAKFQALIKGDPTAIPEMAVTTGQVSVTQTMTSGLPIIAHTASISGGNSGGPLADRCGRVVGVNTFGRVDQEQAAKVNYAIAAPALLEFLKANNVAAAALDTPCTPAAPAAAAAAPAAAAPAEPKPAK